MNKFCKVALGELLGLRLGECAIEKRLFPVVDYLERHRLALQKYVYRLGFCAIMEHVWEGLLQVGLIECPEGLGVWPGVHLSSPCCVLGLGRAGLEVES